MAAKKKKTNQKGNLYLLGAIAFGIIVTTVLWSSQNKQKSDNLIMNYENSIKEKELNIFTSDFMNFSVEVPANFIVKQIDQTAVEFINSNYKISIGRNCTDAQTVEEHLKILDELERNEFSGEQELIQIDGIETAIRTSDLGRTYFVYPENECIVLIFSTDPEAYDDLDQIAQSFRYLGDEE